LRYPREIEKNSDRQGNRKVVYQEETRESSKSMKDVVPENDAAARRLPFLREKIGDRRSAGPTTFKSPEMRLKKNVAPQTTKKEKKKKKKPKTTKPTSVDKKLCKCNASPERC